MMTGEEAGKAPRCNKIAAILDGENLLIGLSNRGLSINWKELVTELGSLGELSCFKVFIPYWVLPGAVQDLKALNEVLPCAELVVTTEHWKEKNVTDIHMEMVASKLLKDADIDIVVIGSGDHFFMDLARECEDAGKAVIILGTMPDTVHRDLVAHRQFVSLMTGRARSGWPFIKQRDDAEMAEAEFEMLSEMIMRGDEGVIRNHHFQLLRSIYQTIKEVRGGYFHDIRKQAEKDHKGAQAISLRYNDENYLYHYALKLFCGEYLLNRRFSAVLVERSRGMYTWLEFYPESKMAMVMEHLLSISHA